MEVQHVPAREVRGSWDPRHRRCTVRCMSIEWRGEWRGERRGEWSDEWGDRLAGTDCRGVAVVRRVREWPGSAGRDVVRWDTVVCSEHTEWLTGDLQYHR